MSRHCACCVCEVLLLEGVNCAKLRAPSGKCCRCRASLGPDLEITDVPNSTFCKLTYPSQRILRFAQPTRRRELSYDPAHAASQSFAPCSHLILAVPHRPITFCRSYPTADWSLYNTRISTPAHHVVRRLCCAFGSAERTLEEA
jgi:hypothetical protein